MAPRDEIKKRFSHANLACKGADDNDTATAHQVIKPSETQHRWLIPPRVNVQKRDLLRSRPNTQRRVQPTPANNHVAVWQASRHHSTKHRRLRGVLVAATVRFLEAVIPSQARRTAIDGQWRISHALGPHVIEPNLALTAAPCPPLFEDHVRHFGRRIPSINATVHEISWDAPGLQIWHQTRQESPHIVALPAVPLERGRRRHSHATTLECESASVSDPARLITKRPIPQVATTVPRVLPIKTQVFHVSIHELASAGDQLLGARHPRHGAQEHRP